MKLNIATSCENAPKKELIKNLTIFFASYDIPQAMQYLADDVIWTLVGDKPIMGREQFAAALMEMAHNKASELTIHSIVTHGKEAAINGEMVMSDGSVFGFADFYEFTSAKGSQVKSITSYVVQKIQTE
ncbi:MAG: nuclear transport factor 2 family protein [Marinoscillum sp.]|uniref:nuclear transport factor 2 family protein n=1 Tax=Marinoscillum sp. TaxID=2024838 RepID=UPI0032FE90ED